MDSRNLVCCLAFKLQKVIVSFLNLPVFLCFNREGSGMVSLHLFCCVVQDSWDGAFRVAAGLVVGRVAVAYGRTAPGDSHSLTNDQNWYQSCS